jgi:hypothetical protein
VPKCSVEGESQFERFLILAKRLILIRDAVIVKA